MLPKLPVFLAIFLIPLFVACGDNETDPSTIADYVRQESRFSSLESTLQESGQLAVLDGPGPLTLFAPINANYPGEQITPENLAAFAGYHIHQGELTTEAMKRVTAISTVVGSEIHVRFGLDGVLLNDGVAIGAETITADNGVIHVIDRALIRPLITESKTYTRSLGVPFEGVTTDFVSIPDIGFVHSLQVSLEIEQESINRMAIYLEHIQSGRSVQLIANPRSTLSDINITLSDSAGFDILNDVQRGNDGQAYPRPWYRPVAPLEFMNGAPITGEWRLVIFNFSNEDEDARLVRWSLTASVGQEPPEDAIVFDARSTIPGVLGRQFSETTAVDLRRVGSLEGVVELNGRAGEIESTTRTLALGENSGSVLFKVPATAEIGPTTIEMSAKAGEVSRILLLDSAIAEPDADGIELLAHVSVAELGAEGHEGNDIWGWTDPVSGAEIAIIGTSNSTAFVDISTPTSPIVLGSLPSHSGATLWRDVKVYGNHAYVVSEAEDHGMQIFDLTLLRDVSAPQTFSETGYVGSFGSAHNVAINEESATAYVVGSDVESCFGGLMIFDLTIPAEPSYTGCFSGGIAAGQPAGPLYPNDVYTHDVQCVLYEGPDTDYQGRELCFSSDEQTVGIVDMQDKSNPIQIVRINYEDAGYTHQGWLTEDHQYFIMNDEFDEVNQSLLGTRSYVWDLQDLDNPVFLGTLDNPRDAIGHNSYIADNVLYQANYTSGLRMVDLSSLPTLPTGVSPELAYYDTYPEDDATCNSSEGCGTASYDGAWSTYPFFESGVIVVSDIKRGLFVLRPTN